MFNAKLAELDAKFEKKELMSKEELISLKKEYDHIYLVAGGFDIVYIFSKMEVLDIYINKL